MKKKAKLLFRNSGTKKEMIVDHVRDDVYIFFFHFCRKILFFNIRDVMVGHQNILSSPWIEDSYSTASSILNKTVKNYSFECN